MENHPHNMKAYGRENKYINLEKDDSFYRENRKGHAQSIYTNQWYIIDQICRERKKREK